MPSQGQVFRNTLLLDTEQSESNVREFNGAVRQAKTGTDALAGSVKQADVAITKMAKSQKQASLGMAQNINLASELALGFGALDPRLRNVGIAFATAGNNAFAFAGFLGPVGVAVATIASAMPAVIATIADFGDETEDAAESTERLANSLGDLVTRIQQAQKARELQMRVEQGAGTLNEQQAHLERTLLDVAETRSALRNAQLEGDFERSRLLIRIGVQEEQAVGRAREALQVAADRVEMERRALADLEVAEGIVNNGRSGGRNRERERERELREQIRAIGAAILSDMALEETRRRVILELEKEQVQAATARADKIGLALAHEKEMASLQAQKLRRAEAQATLDDMRTASVEKEMAAASERKRLGDEQRRSNEDRNTQQDAFNRQLGMTMDITAAIADAALQANEDQSKSFKTLIDEWLKNYAVQQGWLALGAFAEGIFNAVTNPPAAATKFIAGAQHAAIAAAAGGISAAIPNEAAGAAGAGSVGAAPGVGGGGQGGGGNTTVVVNHPVPEAELGRTTNRWTRAADDRDGLRV